jgi:hypothetical protein
MGDFDILCQTTVPLYSYSKPDDFVVKDEATIWHDGDRIATNPDAALLRESSHRRPHTAEEW